MAQTMIPLVSSGTKGPLGAAHLPRLWLKLTLAARGELPEDYDQCGKGFDQMTLTALGLDRQRTIEYVERNHPSYIEFERWVLEQNGGHIDEDRIRKHNDAIANYNHSPEVAQSMRSACGIDAGHINDAVTLNTMDDLDAFHRRLAPTAT
jgi:hypothetical protein